MQSTLICKERLHVAIIMDGNGRWATRMGLRRSDGHQAGARAARRVLEAAPDLGVTSLTLFAFSADNWRRPRAEVSALMGLLRHYLRSEIGKLVDGGIRVTAIGRRDRLPAGLGEKIAAAERASAAGRRLNLRIAIDYSSRDAILHAAAAWRGDGAPSREQFGRLLARGSSDVDLLIRSGGEKRPPISCCGVRLRGVLLRRSSVARFWRRQSTRRNRRFASPRAPLRRRSRHRPP
jgi:undecaprenyl diphosphate synthase